MSARVGIGYDAHPFAVGRALVLGRRRDPPRARPGRPLRRRRPHPRGDRRDPRRGGLGDLGTLFPPDEEQWRDADSLDLLTVALASSSGRVLNVDATLICEEPRIGPHRAEMERTLAQALSARVNVKATTNEGMGWIGRGEGIACVAVALVELD